MKTSSAKAKGRKLQQWVRDKIISYFREFGLSPEDVKSTSMGAGGEDITLSHSAREMFPYSVECKSHQSMAVYKWYEQAKANSGPHEPLLIIKVNNREPLAVVDADHFIFLAKQYERWDRE